MGPRNKSTAVRLRGLSDSNDPLTGQQWNKSGDDKLRGRDDKFVRILFLRQRHDLDFNATVLGLAMSSATANARAGMVRITCISVIRGL
jgi:hypothetical protein